MSTTTEDRKGGAPLLARAGAFATVTFAVLLAWFFAAAALTYFADISPTVIVLGSPSRTMAAMNHSSTRVMGGGPGFIIVQGTDPGFVRDLYAHGAWLVMPSSAEGCGLNSYLRDRLGREKG